MTTDSSLISSPTNSRVKKIVKLRQRSYRDELGLLIIEGYREIKRALDNAHHPLQIFFCRDFFLGKNEDSVIQRCRDNGADVFECAPAAFLKMAYRDRPEGLLAVAPQVKRTLESVPMDLAPLIVVAEAIEKPGNLGAILRSADATGAHAVVVCAPLTDINNPNVVRASIGALFALPVVEASSEDTLAWLQDNDIRVIAATPHADMLYTEADMTSAVAVVLGSEQYGLSGSWLGEAHSEVRIPMLGQSDSLNVASAATILLYEAVRQRGHAAPTAVH